MRNLLDQTNDHVPECLHEVSGLVIARFIAHAPEEDSVDPSCSRRLSGIGVATLVD